MNIVWLVVGFILAIWIAWGMYVNITTEHITYTVIEEFDSVELRSYPKQIIAMVEAPNQNDAFRLLADYILGNNQKETKIAMTAPVMTRGEKIAMTAPVMTKETEMAFYLPEKYNMSSLPKPVNKKIRIEQLPARTYAALTFSWWTAPERVKRKEAQLMSHLLEYQIEVIGEPFLMRYNDPWTPPFMRRNEVVVQIKKP